MPSDRRFRSSDRPRRRQRPEDDQPQENHKPRQERQDPRRRTSFVPRQGSGRPSRSQPPQAPDRTRSSSRQAPAPRYRPQQPPFRTPQREPEPVYDVLDDQDDQVIERDTAHTPAPAGRRPRRTGPARPRQRPEPQQYDQDVYGDEYTFDEEYADRYDDSFIDEDDWYEEEAAAGAYRPRARAANRRPIPSVPRPSIAISRPNIPKPTMPVRVKEAALIQDHRALMLVGVLLVSVVAMVMVTMNRLDELAPGFATHISASGLAESVRSEKALWQLPLMAGALLLMNVVAAWFFAVHSAFSARFLLATSFLVQLVVWVALIRIAF